MNRWVTVGALVCILLGVVMALWIVRVTPNDYIEYYALVNPDEEQGESLDYPKKQFRQDVRKDFLVTQHDQRLHSLLRAKNSELKLSKDERGIAEKMEGITCVMQEELFSQSQLIRYFVGNSGTLFYNLHLLEVDKVTLYRYLAPGNTLIENFSSLSPTMKGTAESAILDFSKGIDFKANRLKVQMFSQEKPL